MGKIFAGDERFNIRDLLVEVFQEDQYAGEMATEKMENNLSYFKGLKPVQRFAVRDGSISSLFRQITTKSLQKAKNITSE